MCSHRKCFDFPTHVVLQKVACVTRKPRGLRTHLLHLCFCPRHTVAYLRDHPVLRIASPMLTINREQP